MNSVDRSTSRQARAKEDKTPAYLAFAKVGGGWQKIGAAWNFRSGENGLSVQLTALPLQFDGKIHSCGARRQRRPERSGRLSSASHAFGCGSFFAVVRGENRKGARRLCEHRRRRLWS